MLRLVVCNLNRFNLVHCLLFWHCSARQQLEPFHSGPQPPFLALLRLGLITVTCPVHVYNQGRAEALAQPMTYRLQFVHLQGFGSLQMPANSLPCTAAVDMEET